MKKEKNKLVNPMVYGSRKLTEWSMLHSKQKKKINKRKNKIKEKTLIDATKR